MESEDDVVKKTRTMEAGQEASVTMSGALNVEVNPLKIRKADIAILLRKLIRDEIQSGKTDKEIYKKLEDDFGETVLYAPKFDLQTAALWLSPLIVAGGAVGVWAFNKHRKQTNVHIMALNLVRGVSLTPKRRKQC